MASRGRKHMVPDLTQPDPAVAGAGAAESDGAGTAAGGEASMAADPGAGGASRNSLTIVTWTALSRITGFVRILAVSAVLGPTYLGNTFQSMTTVPYLAFELLTGSLFATLLVPRLVPSIDRGDPATTARIAGGFLGLAVVGGLALTAVTILGGGLLLSVVSATVADPEIAEAQRRVGWLLLALLMPQILLFGIGGTAGAVMNAHGRFVAPAAGPVLENLGMIATMVAVAVIFGTDVALQSVTDAEIFLLGLGTTAAVALHAGFVWVGALRCGTLIVPRAGWRDPDVRLVLRMLKPSLGYTALGSLRYFVAIVASNSVAGGVIAFTAATNFLKLPIALGARPVAVALLPRLSRLNGAQDPEHFNREARRGFAVAFFVTIPAATVYLILSLPLAEAVSFGEMDTRHGVTLLAVSLAAGALGAVGDAAFLMGTYASYARRDARSPFRAMVLQTGVSLVAMLGVLLVSGDATAMIVIGTAVTLGNLVSGWYLGRRFAPNRPHKGRTFVPGVGRALGASLVMVVPAFVVVDQLEGRVPALAAMGIAGACAVAVYLALQRRWRSPELAFFLAGLRKEPVT